MHFGASNMSQLRPLASLLYTMHFYRGIEESCNTITQTCTHTHTHNELNVMSLTPHSLFAAAVMKNLSNVVTGHFARNFMVIVWSFGKLA